MYMHLPPPPPQKMPVFPVFPDIAMQIFDFKNSTMAIKLLWLLLFLFIYLVI